MDNSENNELFLTTDLNSISLNRGFTVLYYSVVLQTATIPWRSIHATIYYSVLVHTITVT